MSLIGLLVFVLFIAIVLGLVEYILRTAPPPAPWAVVLRVAVALVLLLVLIGMLTGGINSTVIKIQ